MLFLFTFADKIKMARIEFGKEMKKVFALDNESDIAFCNHGSYGAVPNVVLGKRYPNIIETQKAAQIYRYFESSF